MYAHVAGATVLTEFLLFNLPCFAFIVIMYVYLFVCFYPPSLLVLIL
jgi:hypothetical protein